MRNRRRLSYGLLTLLALTLSVAEAAWASASTVEMCHQMAVGSSEVGGEGLSDTDDGHGVHEDRQGHDRPTGPEGHGAPCPFGPVIALHGCTAVPSLPAYGAEAPALHAIPFVGDFRAPTEKDLFLPGGLFRPPRA